MKRAASRLFTAFIIATALSLLPLNIYAEGEWVDLFFCDNCIGCGCNATIVVWSNDGCTMSTCSLIGSSLDANGCQFNCRYGQCDSSCYVVPGNGAIGPCRC